MTSELLRSLLLATAATSVAILLVGLLRLPLRRFAGARAANYLWWLLPASLLAVLLPPLRKAPDGITGTVPGTTLDFWSAPVDATTLTAPSLPVLEPAITATWLAGAVLALCFAAWRQRRFVHSLGRLARHTDDTWRSSAIALPMVLGAWHPKVVLPEDFEQRYTATARELMLMHEQQHIARGDTRIAAVATFAVCTFWFNPLAYWAIRLLRLDLELACDAATIGKLGVSRRNYAEALLETQLVSQLGVALPAGCHWVSNHPLKRRISMLRFPLPSRARVLAGGTCAVAITLAASAALWAAQPPDATSLETEAGDEFVISVNWRAQEISGQIQRGSEPDRRRLAGQPLEWASADGRYQFSCAASRSNAGLAPGLDKHITVRCTVTKDGDIAMRPMMTLSEGWPGSMESSQGSGAASPMDSSSNPSTSGPESRAGIFLNFVVWTTEGHRRNTTPQAQ